jgi:phosphonate transport system substrate-binding protein
MRLVTTFLLFWSVLLAFGGAGHAENDADPRRLRVGITVGTDDTVRERVEPFRVALEAAMDLPVDLFLIDTLDETVDALAKGEIDYARLSSSAYAAAFTRCSCVEPLATARPDAFPGRFYSVLVVRETERTLTFEDLEGGILGIQGPDSIAGYRVPLANLAAEGIQPKTHFRSILRLKDPVDGLHAVLDGRIDAAAAWSTLAGSEESGYTAGSMNDFFVSGAKGLDRLRILWRSPPLPYNAHAIRMELPDAFKRRLRAALLELNDTAPDAYLAIEPDMPGGFEPTVHADYRSVLRTYDPDYADLLKSVLPN